MNGWVVTREHAISSRVYMGVKLSVIKFCASALIPRSTYMTSFLRILQRDTSTPLPTLLPWPCKHSWFGFVSNTISHVTCIIHAHTPAYHLSNTLMPQPCSFTHTHIYVKQKTRSYTQTRARTHTYNIIYTTHHIWTSSPFFWISSDPSAVIVTSVTPKYVNSPLLCAL